MVQKTADPLAITHNDNPVQCNSFTFSAYPNPFNSSISIRYILSQATKTEFQVVNVLGKVVYNQSLARSSGDYQEIVWNGADQHNIPLPSGPYWIVLRNGNKQALSPVMLVR
ncbi:MAG: T9SS type A sorting domain-containing protein [Candidatus Electryoneaceae bacterium]|nr:T9SS type A sorting domain-containing protein [Candidatus Electryoneaceae bacterium]